MEGSGDTEWARTSTQWLLVQKKLNLISHCSVLTGTTAPHQTFIPEVSTAAEQHILIYQPSVNANTVSQTV